MITYLEPKRVHPMGGWKRKVSVAGVVYYVGIEQGRRVRIAYKPRGENWGHLWYGSVYTEDGCKLWGANVPGSLGVRGLLTEAGVISQADHGEKCRCRLCGEARWKADEAYRAARLAALK